LGPETLDLHLPITASRICQAGSPPSHQVSGYQATGGQDRAQASGQALQQQQQRMLPVAPRWHAYAFGRKEYTAAASDVLDLNFGVKPDESVVSRRTSRDTSSQHLLDELQEVLQQVLAPATGSTAGEVREQRDGAEAKAMEAAMGLAAACAEWVLGQEIAGQQGEQLLQLQDEVTRQVFIDGWTQQAADTAGSVDVCVPHATAAEVTCSFAAAEGALSVEQPKAECGKPAVMACSLPAASSAQIATSTSRALPPGSAYQSPTVADITHHQQSTTVCDILPMCSSSSSMGTYTSCDTDTGSVCDSEGDSSSESTSASTVYGIKPGTQGANGTASRPSVATTGVYQHKISWVKLLADDPDNVRVHPTAKCDTCYPPSGRRLQQQQQQQQQQPQQQWKQLWHQSTRGSPSLPANKNIGSCTAASSAGCLNSVTSEPSAGAVPEQRQLLQQVSNSSTCSSLPSIPSCSQLQEEVYRSHTSPKKAITRHTKHGRTGVAAEDAEMHHIMGQDTSQSPRLPALVVPEAAVRGKAGGHHGGSPSQKLPQLMSLSGVPPPRVACAAVATHMESVWRDPQPGPAAFSVALDPAHPVGLSQQQQQQQQLALTLHCYAPDLAALLKDADAVSGP
jgi:hypothetical protein